MSSHSDRFRDGLRIDARAIMEDAAVEHVGQLLVPAQPMPVRGGGFDELEDHRQRGDPRPTALGALGPQPHGGEGRFDDVGAAQRGPMRRGIAVEGEQLVPMGRQTGDRFGILLGERRHEALPRRLRLVARRGQGDVVEPLLRLALEAGGQLLQHVRGLVDPAELWLRLRELLRQRHPEAQRPVPRGHRGSVREAAAFHLPQEAAPTVRRFPEAVLDGDEFLRAVGAGADDDQQTLPVGVQPDVEVDAVDPPIDVPTRREIALAPGLVLPLPDLLEPHDGLRREAEDLRAQNRLERLVEIARRDALQIQDGQQLLDVRGAPQVRGDQRAGKPRFVVLGEHPIVDPWRGDLQGTRAGHNAADRPVAIADDLPTALVIHQVLIPFEEQIHLDLDGALHQLPRALPDHFVQRQPRHGSLWTIPH